MGRPQQPSAELTQAISAILQKHHAEIRALGLNFVDFKGASIRAFDDIQTALTEIRSRLPRRDFPAKTKRIYREVSLFRFRGRCQIYPDILIVDPAGRVTEQAEFDHFVAHSENGLDQGWVVSRKANRTIRNKREQYRPEFAIFQRELRAHLRGNKQRPVLANRQPWRFPEIREQRQLF